MREYVMEFIGAMFLVLAIALTRNPLAIGITLMVMVYIGGHVSGAHYNPAVTLSVYIRGKIRKYKILGYVSAQVLGAIAAAAIAYNFGISFIPSPNYSFSFFQAVLAETLFTFALCIVILTVATAKKFEGNYVYGLAIGSTVAAGAFAVGNISGGVFNPAVALGPMIFGSFVGNVNWNNLLIYLIGPFLGAVIAAKIFEYLNPKEK